MDRSAPVGRPGAAAGTTTVRRLGPEAAHQRAGSAWNAGASRLRGRTLTVALAAATLLGACGPGPVPSGSGGPDDTMPPLLAGLPLTTLTVGALELTVAVADTPDARSRGLSGTADLGPLEGLLFAYPQPINTGFFMRGVVMPLDIAFVGADGRVLDVLTMPLCDTDPCPTYGPTEPFRWAIETPAGGLSGVSAGDLIEIASG